jgi:hypothetical protein
MGLDGVLAHHEGERDLPVGHSTSEEQEDLELAGGETINAAK